MADGVASEQVRDDVDKQDNGTVAAPTGKVAPLKCYHGKRMPAPR